MSSRQHLHGATLQPSSDEIQREVENLRDIRRRSTAVGGPVIDPDLPWQGGASDDGSSMSGSEDRSSTEEPQTPADDPFHLFWVPARMHPEIDPSEFRSFLKEHARAPDGQLARSGSVGSVGLGRKRSMLSKQYNPQNDRDSDDGKEPESPLRRNRTSYYASGPQLTIKDLEKLDELAEEASQSSDPTRLRSVLRRSLSMNVSPSAIDKMDSQPEEGDEADAPIFIPRQNQILRRAARTKIRKPGQVGEGSHRFTATRRGPGARSATTNDMDMPPDVPPLPASSVEGSEPRSSSDLSSSSEHDGLVQPRPRRATQDDVRLVERPDSYSAETFIYDAYAADDYDDKGAIIVSPLSPSQPVELPLHRSPSPPPTSAPAPVLSPEPEPTSVSLDFGVFDTSAPALSLGFDLQHPAPQRAATLSGGIIEPSRGESPDSITSASATPVPATAIPISTPQPQPQAQAPLTPIAQPQLPVHARTASLEALRHTPSPGPEQGGRKEKDKKGGLFKWGSSDKKSKKDKEKDRHSGGSSSSHGHGHSQQAHAHSLSHEIKEKEKEREKEKDAGFFGSLFGGSKKKHEDGPPGLGQHAGREAAAALLGASKGRATATPSPGPGPGGLQPNNYSRYPIHVERAIYRLSHIKLANPRRPLYEQVLISNLMFWYLGVINKAQTQAQQGPQPQAGQGQAPVQPQPQQAQQPTPQANGNAAPEPQPVPQAQQEEPEAGRRRAGLTKGPAGAGGARRNEAPVRGPQYDLQHRAMEQERVYPAGGASPVKGVAGRGSVDSARGSLEYEHVAHGHGVGGVNGRPALAHSQSQQQWQEQTQQARQALEQQQQRPDRSRSPPQNRYELGKAIPSGATPGSRSPSRSVSASAVAPVGAMQNGHGHHNVGGIGGAGRASPGRKTQSAHAVAPGQGRPGRQSEDEDVPLAMWQQQQQQRRGR